MYVSRSRSYTLSIVPHAVASSSDAVTQSFTFCLAGPFDQRENTGCPVHRLKPFNVKEIHGWRIGSSLNCTWSVNRYKWLTHLERSIGMKWRRSIGMKWIRRHLMIRRKEVLQTAIGLGGEKQASVCFKQSAHRIGQQHLEPRLLQRHLAAVCIGGCTN